MRKEYRGQMKSRTWRALKAQGALPESHIAAYEEALKAGGGKIKADGLDHIINKGIQWVTLPNGKNRLEVVEHHPLFTKKSSRSFSTKHGSYAQGVILEEARTRCGTQAYLEEALVANRVMCGSDGLYYFRSNHIGREDIFTKQETSMKNIDAIDVELAALEEAVGDALEEGQNALDTIAGKGGGTGCKEMVDCAFEVGPAVGGKGGGKVGVVVNIALDTKVTTLDRATKVAENMRDQALVANLSSSRANVAVSQLMDTLEGAEISNMDNRFLLKFSKTQKGDLFTTEMAEANAKKVDLLVTDLISDARSLKVHCGKA